MLNMKSINEKIKQKSLKISQFKKYVNELINLINEANEKLNTIEKTFQSHFKYNQIIFNTYKEDKKNYYILSSFNSLNFNFENDYLQNDILLKK